MYPDWIWVLLGALFIWLGVLTFWIWKQGNFLKSLFPKSGEADLKKRFEELLEEIRNSKKDLAEVKDKLDELEKQGQVHIQKVAFLRYNPYGDTGGNISFTMALLNNKGTGFVLTSLHARSQTRVFAKQVMEGKAEKFKFSKEEEQVVKEALEK